MATGKSDLLFADFMSNHLWNAARYSGISNRMRNTVHEETKIFAWRMSCHMTSTMTMTTPSYYIQCQPEEKEMRKIEEMRKRRERE